MERTAQRRLAAVLAADVAGYSRLMEADEDGTIAAWKAARVGVIDPAIAAHGGRIVKHTGDGFLAEFAAVSDAVNCAAAMQKALAPSALAFRIGVHLGDVVEELGDIHGDGVNIAARLESLAEPGGICVSADVYNQVHRRTGLAFEDLGEQPVKNMAPVHAYRLRLDGAASAAAPRAARVAIAVLPFANMSGDAEQEYFADGLTEDIITELSRFGELFVISRNSTFTYKGRAAKVKEVARDLGVDYVVEGSVRKAGNRVRVTVQLIDAETDRHVWADRYDRELEDIFAIQDAMTAAIVAILPARVEADSHERARRKPPASMAAYECVLAGKVLHHRATREANAEAQRLLERAIALDPGYAHAHAWRACVLGQGWGYGWCADKDATFREVVAEAETALALDDNDADVHRIVGAIHIGHDDFDRAVYHQERALMLNPNYDLVVVQQGELLTWLGRAEEGIEWIQKAMRLNPYHPPRFWGHLGRAYFVARRCAEAVDAIRRIPTPDLAQHAFLASAHAALGEKEEAAAHASEIVRLDPAFSVERFLATLHYREEADREHHRQALRAAGLPA